jgi:hypothetical protein
MAWTCAECRETEGNDKIFVNAVCHHCGKPLCGNDRFRILDEVFSEVEGKVSRMAVHCKTCKQKYHPKVSVAVGADR